MRTYSSLLGAVEHSAGRVAEARAWFGKSRQLAVSLKDQPGIGQAAQNIGITSQLEGEAARQRGDETTALRLFHDARRFVDEGLEIKWAQKRDTLQNEIRRRAGGGAPSQMLRALEGLTLACARAGIGEAALGTEEEEALVKIEQFPPPFPAFAASLRQLAAGQLPPIPSSLSDELRQIVEPVVQAIREARGQ